MPIPQPVLDGLTKVSADADALTAAYADQSQKGQELAGAQHAKDVSDAAVAAGVNTLEADKAALKALIDSTFISTPPAG
jgi:hypothetical protein